MINHENWANLQRVRLNSELVDFITLNNLLFSSSICFCRIVSRSLNLYFLLDWGWSETRWDANVVFVVASFSTNLSFYFLISYNRYSLWFLGILASLFVLLSSNILLINDFIVFGCFFWILSKRMNIRFIYLFLYSAKMYFLSSFLFFILFSLLCFLSKFIAFDQDIDNYGKINHLLLWSFFISMGTGYGATLA